ncbi:MAG: ribosomal protein S18-alanine N-acetyltransferase [Vulcanimicrobiaceae bacterium]
MKLDLRPQGAGQPGGLMIAPMTDPDIAQVMQIETLSFPSTWPQNAFHNEIHENKLAHYFVGRIGERVVAYGGIWVILEDSHITTIAVHPDERGKKYGEIMLLHLLDETISRGASWITLEVRETNEAAQRLYRKYGFTVVSTRRGYYSDNNESALVMWAGNLKGPLYLNRLRALRNLIDA